MRCDTMRRGAHLLDSKWLTGTMARGPVPEFGAGFSCSSLPCICPWTTRGGSPTAYSPFLYSCGDEARLKRTTSANFQSFATILTNLAKTARAIPCIREQACLLLSLRAQSATTLSSRAQPATTSAQNSACQADKSQLSSASSGAWSPSLMSALGSWAKPPSKRSESRTGLGDYSIHVSVALLVFASRRQYLQHPTDLI